MRLILLFYYLKLYICYPQNSSLITYKVLKFHIVNIISFTDSLLVRELVRWFYPKTGL